MAQILQTLSTTSFILAVVFLALAGLLFFVFDIRSIINELTGKTAAAEIARIREQGPVRQFKGKSLQSIILEGGGDSTNFSLDKLDAVTKRSTSSAKTSAGFSTGFTHHEKPVSSVSEAETSFLAPGSEGSSEQETSEQETSLLGVAEVTEEGVSTLDTVETTEQETGLLGSIETTEEEATLLDGTHDNGKSISNSSTSSSEEETGLLS